MKPSALRRADAHTAAAPLEAGAEHVNEVVAEAVEGRTWPATS